MNVQTFLMICASACVVVATYAADATAQDTGAMQPGRTVPGYNVLNDAEFDKLAGACAPGMAIDTLRAIITTESSGNPYAIGVVDAHLVRQPRDADEALATALELDKVGKNYSVGLMQINKKNLDKTGGLVGAFNVCRNLAAGNEILGECYSRVKLLGVPDSEALQQSLSCYYSGDVASGFAREADGKSYVERVVDNAAVRIPSVRAAIPLVNDRAAAPKAPVRQSTSDWIQITQGDSDSGKPGPSTPNASQ